MYGECKKTQLTTKKQIAVKCVSKNTCKGARYIDVLYMVGFYKKEIKSNKHIYGGTSMLDLLKLTMMKFHYDIIHDSFEGRYNLIYSDTDSLVYNIKHDNIYQWIKENKSHFDLSDSVREALKDDENKQVIGKIKDETNTLPKTETCSSEPDMLFFQNIARRTIRSIIRRSQKVFKNMW